MVELPLAVIVADFVAFHPVIVPVVVVFRRDGQGSKSRASAALST
jgi:hypothetical protein